MPRNASIAAHRAKLEARDEAAARGKKPGGRPPAPPVEGPQPKDQINLTDEDSRIRRLSYFAVEHQMGFAVPMLIGTSVGALNVILAK